MVPDGRSGREASFQGVQKVDLHGWALDAGDTRRDAVNRDGALIQWTARGPFTADVERHDRITVFGERFQIDGGVIRQPGPTSLTSHTILSLAKWAG